MNNRTMVLSLISTFALSACGGDSRDEQRAFEEAAEHFEEIMRINNDGNEVDLVLTDGSVYMQLSKEKLEEIKQEFEEERSEKEDSAFARSIKNMVLNTVEEMLHKKIEYPLDEVNSISWDDGELIIDVAHRKIFDFTEIETDGGDVMETFDEDDALAFIDAYEKAKAQL